MTDNLILLQEYHAPQNGARQNEYLKCLETNIKNKYIKKIEIFIEPDTKPPIESSKINYNIVSDRPTFQDLFYFCNKTYPDQICMISNADIMFDNTLSFINQDNMKNKFIALTRREERRGKEVPFARGGWSQDTWIFKSPVKIEGANFKMGIIGCDNRIAYLAHKSGMLVTNPSDQIRAKHLHQSEYRTISKDDERRILGRYLYVHPNNNINTPSRVRKIYKFMNKKISLVGNCQIKALTWYIQELNSDFDVKYIWVDIGMGNWSKNKVFQGKSTPIIIDTQASQDRLSESDYIIYQPIRPSRIKHFNYEDIQKYKNNAKLISIGCFYCKNIDTTKLIDNKEYEAKTGLLGMKERADQFGLDIQPHQIIEKHGVDAMATDTTYHPQTLYFLELVREICAKTGWDYYSDEQYNQYLKEGYPFQRHR